MQIDKEIQEAFELQRSKDYLAAEKIYANLYKKYPDNTSLLTLYGILKIQTEDFENAINLLKMSLGFDSDNEITLSNLGIVYFNVGKFEDSVKYLNKAIHLNSGNSNYFYYLGNSLRKLMSFEQALSAYQSAISLTGDDIQSLFGLAYTYKELNKLNEALIIFKKIIEIECSNILALMCAGSILLERKEFDEGIFYFEKVIELENSNLDALFNKGLCLSRLNKLTEALYFYNQILEINCDDINTLINRGLVLRNLGFYNEAYSDFNHVLRINSNNYGALFNLSLLKLLEGNFDEGLKLYEFRKELNLGKYKLSSKPTWLNNFSINNKVLLIHSDQGLGDFIQCYRYISLLKKSGAHIILITPKSLTKIIQNQNPKITIIEEGQVIPHFDFECPIMSLPYAFKTNLQSIPSTFPYLQINTKSERLSTLREEKIQKIGIVWRGSSDHDDDFRRSIDIKIIEPIFRQKFEFHIIQKDLNQEERSILNFFDNIVIHSDNLNDFSDTSIIINDMDFIISVDTSVCHLAGAMNKKTYLLLPFSPDFRWLLNLNTSPWYPSFNIIRQTKNDDWRSAIDKLITNYLRLG